MKSKFLYLLTITLTLYMVFINISIVNAKTIENFSKNSTLPEIEATSAILIDAKTGLVVYEKNSNAKLYPASITKIMTALLAIESSNNNYNQKVLFSKDAVFSIPTGTSNIAMNDGETLTLEEALYGLLLASANEVANAIAEHVGLSSENFVELMNKRAKELGAKNTNFVNPHGLHDDNHYTTAFDMALIMKEAVKNDEFVKITSTKSYKIPPTEKQPEERPLNNSNKLIFPGKYYNEFVIGSKTGYTNEAKHTLVTYAKKDDVKLICVVLQNEKNITYVDTTKLLEYGFNNYKDLEVFNKDEYSSKISILDSSDKVVDEISVIAKESITIPLPYFINKEDIIVTKNLPLSVSPPIFENELIGQLILSYNGTTITKVNLYPEKTLKEVPRTLTSSSKKVISNRMSIPDNLLKMAIFTFIFLLIVPILARLSIFLNTKKNKKRAKLRNKKLLEQSNKNNEPIGTIRSYKYRNE